MAYSTDNPPALLVKRVGKSGAVWWYASTDAIAVVDGANYFSNALELGMKQNDVIFIANTTGNLLTIGKVGAVTAAGAAATTALTAVP